MAWSICICFINKRNYVVYFMESLAIGENHGFIPVATGDAFDIFIPRLQMFSR